MREIKFRAWDEEMKQMESWDDILELWDNEVCDPGSMFQNDHWVMLQFIGIYDWKGKEIYERDIVKASIYMDEPESILEVKHEKGCFIIDYKDSDSDHVPVGWFVGRIEVIGNIYESPELLKEGV